MTASETGAERFGILGNENAVSSVRSMITKGRIPHSIVIYGEKGLGKKTLAQYIAASLLCKDRRDDGSPCGICKSCNMILGGGHPDLIRVIPSLKSGGYKLEEDLRALVTDALIAPNESRYKVYLISDMDNTPRESQNALLKLIEEPPEHAVIILTAGSKEYFLPTILSRVISFGVVPVTREQCSSYLKAHTAQSDDDIDRAVTAMGGNIGMCLEFFDSRSLVKAVDTTVSIALAIAAKNEYEILKSFWVCNKDKELTLSVLKHLQNIFRDASLLHIGGNASLIGCSEKAARALSDNLSGRQLGQLCEIPEKYIFRINGNASLTLCLNAVCADIRSALC